jgi:hypothetical protein
MNTKHLPIILLGALSAYSAQIAPLVQGNTWLFYEYVSNAKFASLPPSSPSPDTTSVQVDTIAITLKSISASHDTASCVFRINDAGYKWTNYSDTILNSTDTIDTLYSINGQYKSSTYYPTLICYIDSTNYTQVSYLTIGDTTYELQHYDFFMWNSYEAKDTLISNQYQGLIYNVSSSVGNLGYYIKKYVLLNFNKQAVVIPNRVNVMKQYPCKPSIQKYPSMLYSTNTIKYLASSKLSLIGKHISYYAPNANLTTR